MDEPGAQRRLTAATYNIHAWVGTDGQWNPSRVLEIMHALDVGILALQEVDFLWGEGATAEEVLCREMNCRVLPGPTMVRGTSRYGNMLLTRLPVLSYDQRDLGVDGREPRCCIDALLDADGTSLRVLATHLGLKRNERICQVRSLLGALDEDGEYPTILLGDFNFWMPFFGASARLRHRVKASPLTRTFPANRPLLALDRIYLSDGMRFGRVGSLDTPATRLASDHLPLRAEIILP
jgi:endonuclease/exonuclease/phosphatase family metal-dependent hydrolase